MLRLLACEPLHIRANRLNALFLKSLDVCTGERFLGITHINVRDILAETGVSLKFILETMLRVDGPLSVGISSDSKVILLELGTERRFAIPSSLIQYIEHTTVYFDCAICDSYITLYAENLPRFPYICQVPLAKHAIVNS